MRYDRRKHLGRDVDVLDAQVAERRDGEVGQRQLEEDVVDPSVDLELGDRGVRHGERRGREERAGPGGVGVLEAGPDGERPERQGGEEARQVFPDRVVQRADLDLAHLRARADDLDQLARDEPLPVQRVRVLAVAAALQTHHEPAHELAELRPALDAVEEAVGRALADDPDRLEQDVLERIAPGRAHPEQGEEVLVRVPLKGGRERFWMVSMLQCQRPRVRSCVASRGGKGDLP